MLTGKRMAEAPAADPASSGMPGLPLAMLFGNPPGHTWLRGLVHRAFTPGVVESLGPRIREIASASRRGVGRRWRFKART